MKMGRVKVTAEQFGRQGPTDYDKLLHKLYELMGDGKWHRTSVTQVAATIEEGSSAVQRAKNILHAVDGIETRYVGIPGKLGKKAEWRLPLSEEEVRRRMKAGGWDWSEPSQKRAKQKNGTADGRNVNTTPRKHVETKPSYPRSPTAAVDLLLGPAPKNRDSEIVGLMTERAMASAKNVPDLQFRDRVAVGTDEKGGVMAVAGPEPASPFEGLRVMRREEAAALIEAARKYAQRVSFIDEQRVRFQEMGIDFNPDAIKFDRDERLEHIGLVLAYINSLERTASALEDQNRSLRAPNADLAAAREELRKAKHQIERMVSEKVAAEEATKRLMEQHRQEIRQLNESLERANRERGELSAKLKERNLDRVVADVARPMPTTGIPSPVVVRPSILTPDNPKK